jgi:hypothetical protein
VISRSFVESAQLAGKAYPAGSGATEYGDKRRPSV